VAGAKLQAIDRWQRRHTAPAFLVAVVRKFLDDRASTLAALIAYYAFFSLFPLLLALVSILGFVLQDDPALQAEVLDSALARIPVVGGELEDEIEPLTGSEVALVIGLAGALWAGLGVTLAMGRAFEAIWDVPRFDRRGAVSSRVAGLLVIAVVGVALIGATVATGSAVGLSRWSLIDRLSVSGGALAVNAVVFLIVFALLTARPMRIRELLPGVLLAAVGSVALQSAGGWYVERAVAQASPTYGTFALVIGLLSWFWLGAHLLLVAGEVNVVRQRRLWPRSLTGPLGAADREALRRTAEAARQDERLHVAVRFDDPDDGGDGGADLPDGTPEGLIAPDRQPPEDCGVAPISGEEQTVSTLVAIAYPDRETAEKVREELIAATREHLVQLEDAVIVEREQGGRIKLHQAMGTTAAGAAGGAAWGGLIGLLFLAPLLGMAVGAATGGLGAKISDGGVSDDFVKNLGAGLRPGSAALIVLGSTDARDKLIERVKRYGGAVMQTSLSRQDEEHLRDALGAGAVVA